MKVVILAVIWCGLGFNSVSIASEVSIKAVNFKQSTNGFYQFNVTLAHADKSWQHYANLWQIETLSGEVLGTRVLLHPHINEQAFTRSLSNIKIPKSVTKVIVRAGCTIDGINSKKIVVELGARSY